jgi:hypothetical protein
VFGPATLLNVFEGVSDEELEMIVAARIAGLGKSFEGRGNLDTPDRRIKRIETALNTLARAVNHYIARVKEKA